MQIRALSLLIIAVGYTALATASDFTTHKSSSKKILSKSGLKTATIVKPLKNLKNERPILGDVCNRQRLPEADDEDPHRYLVCELPKGNISNWHWPQIGIWVRKTCKRSKVFSPIHLACRPGSSVRRSQQARCQQWPASCGVQINVNCGGRPCSGPFTQPYVPQPQPQPYVPQPQPYVPEPQPYVPQPEPYVPEPTPYIPEPPMVIEPSVQPYVPQPQPCQPMQPCVQMPQPQPQPIIQPMPMPQPEPVIVPQPVPQPQPVVYPEPQPVVYPQPQPMPCQPNTYPSYPCIQPQPQPQPIIEPMPMPEPIVEPVVIPQPVQPYVPQPQPCQPQPQPCQQPYPCPQPAPCVQPVSVPAPQPVMIPAPQPTAVVVPEPQPMPQYVMPQPQPQPCQPAVQPCAPVQQVVQPQIVQHQVVQPQIIQPQVVPTPQVVVQPPIDKTPRPCSIQSGRYCSWMMSPLAKHSSPYHFQQCVPASGYCGTWKTRPCAPGTRFEVRIQVCVHAPRAEVAIQKVTAPQVVPTVISGVAPSPVAPVVVPQPTPQAVATAACGPAAIPLGQCNRQFQCPGYSRCNPYVRVCCQQARYSG